MEKFDKKIIDNLEKARRLAFPNFDNIELKAKSVRLISNLFLNPDCRSDINLDLLANNNDIKLSVLSKHIITAAPVTLASYSRDHHKLVLDRYDILKCFSEDHIKSVEDNKLDIKKSATYALAHIMTVGTIVAVRNNKLDRLVDVKSLISNKIIFFKNVTVPIGLELQIGDLIWQHFGTIIDKVGEGADKKVLFNSLSWQTSQVFMNKIILGAHTETQSIIDFSNKSLFGKDVTGQVANEKRARKVEKIAEANSSLNLAHGNIENKKIIFNA